MKATACAILALLALAVVAQTSEGAIRVHDAGITELKRCCHFATVICRPSPSSLLQLCTVLVLCRPTIGAFNSCHMQSANSFQHVSHLDIERYRTASSQCLFSTCLPYFVTSYLYMDDDNKHYNQLTFLSSVAFSVCSCLLPHIQLQGCPIPGQGQQGGHVQGMR